MRNREIRTTQEQMSAMLNFMVEHRNFSNEKIIGPTGRAKSNELLERLTDTLNSLGNGPIKMPVNGRRCGSIGSPIQKKNQEFRPFRGELEEVLTQR